jgi:hypothetical protein
VTFARTDLLGVYTVTGIAGPGASSPAAGSSSGEPAPASPSSPVLSASPGAAASPAFPTAEAGAPVRFAVDLLDVDESTIAPGDAAKLTALGAVAAAAGGAGSSPDAAASPGASAGASGGGSTGVAESRPNARDELWIPIVLVALLLLTAEWLVYERDTLARLRRALAGRLGRPRATGRGA